MTCRCRGCTRGHARCASSTAPTRCTCSRSHGASSAAEPVSCGRRAIAAEPQEGDVRSRPMAGRGVAAVAAGLCALVAVHAADAATSTPNDPLFANGDQWALTGAAVSIDAPAAWCAASGAGVTVADIDTGADFQQQDLAGRLIAGAAFLDGTGQQSGTDVSDGFGHGTMTTGIMVAATNNGAGIASVAPGA